MLIFLLKTDYNTKVAAIDTKISSLDDKITKNKNMLDTNTLNTLLLSIGNSMFDGGDRFQAY